MAEKSEGYHSGVYAERYQDHSVLKDHCCPNWLTPSQLSYLPSRMVNVFHLSRFFTILAQLVRCFEYQIPSSSTGFSSLAHRLPQIMNKPDFQRADRYTISPFSHLFFVPPLGLTSSGAIGCNITLFGVCAVLFVYPLLQS